MLTELFVEPGVLEITSEYHPFILVLPGIQINLTYTCTSCQALSILPHHPPPNPPETLVSGTRSASQTRVGPNSEYGPNTELFVF